MRFGIIGAGIAGLACAEVLRARGLEVVLFDKGRGAGGRMSTRRMPTPAGEASFDYGAQYFTVRDDRFERQVAQWIAQGIVAAWPSARAGAYVGVRAMNSVVSGMAEAHNVRWKSVVSAIERRERRWRFIVDGDEAPVDIDTAIIAVPAEQASLLLASISSTFAERAMHTPSDPCWTLMLCFDEPVAVQQDCWSGEGTVSWAARNNSKPGRSGPESWVVQANPAWSRQYLEADAAWVATALKNALAIRLGCELPHVLAEATHRWRYARSGSESSVALWDAALRLGVCGDWLLGARVEAAWLSGSALAHRIIATNNPDDT